MSSRDQKNKREIAKQFDLPERQSKIATMLKESDLYCICRTTDSTRFMIACDSCEEWYHGDCINITEPESRNIKHYFCPPCMEKNPSLEIEYKKSKHREKSTKSESKKLERSKKDSNASRSSSDKASVAGCGSCSGCLKVSSCGKCDRCKWASKHGRDGKRYCRERECRKSKQDHRVFKHKEENVILQEQIQDSGGSGTEDNWVPPSKPKSTSKKSTPGSGQRGRKSKIKIAKEAARNLQNRRAAKRNLQFSEDEDSKDEEEDEERQCKNLTCCNAARKKSKYCSQECGVSLATYRLNMILPGRVQEWNLSPCYAEERNKKDLEDVRQKQLEAKNKIAELEKQRTALDHQIIRVKKLAIDPDAEDEEPEEEGIIYCISCGVEVAVKSCLKHMERCYNKFETQTSFGSIYKTNFVVGTPIFCDYFNPLNDSYCKRLQVLCPEHTKEPKVSDFEICGSPLMKNTTQLPFEICRLPKKKCSRHFCWEKLRRAEIDLERVRNWLKLDELLEQERQLRIALGSRASVLGLLLNSTFDHELRDRIQSQMCESYLQKKPNLDPISTTASSGRNKEKDLEASNSVDETGGCRHTSVASNVKYGDKEATGSNDETEGDFEEIVRRPLIKKRDKQRSQSTEKRKNTVVEEMTASKLYKSMQSS